jgi:hypothetical protein
MNWYRKVALNYDLPSEFDATELGCCMWAAELAAKELETRGVTEYYIVEGWVVFMEDPEDEYTHTWIEHPGGIWDPTKEQFRKWGFDPDEMSYVKIKKEYTPSQYLELCKDFPDTRSQDYEKKIQEDMEHVRIK